MSHLHTCIGFLKIVCYPSEYVVPWHSIIVRHMMVNPEMITEVTEKVCQREGQRCQGEFSNHLPECSIKSCFG